MSGSYKSVFEVTGNASTFRARESCRGFWKGSKPEYIDVGKSGNEEERALDSGETSLLALQACRASEGLCSDWVSHFFPFFVDFFLLTF